MSLGGSWLNYFGGQRQRIRSGLGVFIQNKTVVRMPRGAELVHSRAERRGRGKIERRAFYVLDFPGGDQRGVRFSCICRR